MSKGSSPRQGRDDKAFATGWERIFKKDAQAGENALQALTELSEGLGLYDEEFMVPKLGPCKSCGSSDVDGPYHGEFGGEHWGAICRNCGNVRRVDGPNVDPLLDAWNGTK